MSDNPLYELIALENDARAFGFDWPDREMIIDQAISECDEIKEAIAKGESSERVQEEIGDLLHTALSLCLFSGFDPELTFKKTVDKFAKRMSALKQIASAQGLSTLEGQSFDLMMALWNQAKSSLK